MVLWHRIFILGCAKMVSRHRIFILGCAKMVLWHRTFILGCAKMVSRHRTFILGCAKMVLWHRIFILGCAKTLLAYLNQLFKEQFFKEAAKVTGKAFPLYDIYHGNKIIAGGDLINVLGKSITF
jgi:hypothetical protein